MDLLTEARELQPELSSLRRVLHRHAEVGMELPFTVGKIREVLASLDIPDEPVAGGVRAWIGRDGGKRILLRADMDALPIVEATGLEFSSENPGTMHACGHDLHATMLLGAARILKRHESELEGQVVLMFQPGEECGDGARSMMDAGLLDPMPDRAVAIHIAATPEYPTGVAVVNAGITYASRDRFLVTVTGKGGHGAEPQTCRNPIYGTLKIIEAFTDLARFETDPSVPLVLSVCRIEAGTAVNIVPETCTFEGTLRMTDEKSRPLVHARMRSVVAGIGDAYGMKGEILLDGGLPMVVNDAEFARDVHGWLSDGLPGMQVAPLANYLSMGSDDFAEISTAIPSCYIMILSRSPEGRHFPEHNPSVIFDEDAIACGAAAFARIASSYLGHRNP